MLALAAVVTVPAMAQSVVPSPTAPAVATSTSPTPAEAPIAGANSFTEAQAQKRIEDLGYTAVMGLKKDEQSIWRGTAMKAGASTAVALDFQGNVVANPTVKR